MGTQAALATAAYARAVAGFIVIGAKHSQVIARLTDTLLPAAAQRFLNSVADESSKSRCGQTVV
jgi:hypothetical protein